MMRRMRSYRLVCGAAAVAAMAAGCASDTSHPRVDFDISRLPPDVFVEEAAIAKPAAPLSLDEAIRLALERDPAIGVLRAAADVARAQARTVTDLRNPEVSVAFGEGSRVTDRSWLVPRSEIVPSISYPYRDLYLTTHEEELFRSTDPRVPRVLVPPGGEEAYLQESPRTYSGTTADSEMIRTGLRFFPPNPWMMRAQGAEARANYAAAVSDLHAAEWVLQCRVRWLFARISYLRKDAGHLAELIAARKAIAEATSAMAAQQELSAVESVAAAQRHLSSIAEREQVLLEAEELRGELEGMVGQGVDVDGARVPDGAALTASAARRIELGRRTLENRREVSSAYWRSQAAEAVLRQARATRLPWFTQIETSYGRSRRKDRMGEAWEMNGGYADIDPVYSIPVDETEDSEWRVEAVVSIPIFSLGPGATRVQRAEHRQAMAELGAAARQAMREVSHALSALEAAEQRDAMVAAELGPRLQETRALLDSLRDEGAVAPTELAKVKEIAIEMLRMAARSSQGLVEARLQLELAVGLSTDMIAESAAAVSEAAEPSGETPSLSEPAQERPDAAAPRRPPARSLKRRKR